MAGIYVHIPFCKSRCIYCDFFSTTMHDMQTHYVDALLTELSLRHDFLQGAPISTIYIGGGTPSTLSPSNLKRLCAALLEQAGGSVDEFTIECNPDDVTPLLVDTLVQCGVNRVSMGAQTFSDARLHFLNRRHKSSQVDQAVATLRSSGIANISIDLMFGFPDETVSDWLSDINHALSLNVKHISAYSLMYEEGTLLYSMLNQGKIHEIDEDTSLAMYDTLIDRLTNAGYEHYEISNFSLPNFHSIHNSNYWKQVPYLGIGAAAHSYDILSRQCNIPDVKQYIHALSNATDDIKAENSYIDQIEVLNETEQYNDLITTTLRTRSGILLEQLTPSDRSFLQQASRKGLQLGNLIIQDSHLRLTRQGLYISDDVMSDLIRV